MNELDKLREEIDKLDLIIASTYAQRLEVVRKIGEYKKVNNVAVLDSGREDIVYKNVSSVATGYEKEICDLYNYIMSYSRQKQKQ